MWSAKSWRTDRPLYPPITSHATGGIDPASLLAQGLHRVRNSLAAAGLGSVLDAFAGFHRGFFEEFAFAEPDWTRIEEGQTDLVVSFPPQRRLEDRVLDVLRVTLAAGSAEALTWERVDLSTDASCDELVLADMLREKGWV